MDYTAKYSILGTRCDGSSPSRQRRELLSGEFSFSVVDSKDADRIAVKYASDQISILADKQRFFGLVITSLDTLLRLKDLETNVLFTQNSYLQSINTLS